MSKIAEINDKFRAAVLTEPQKDGRCVLTQSVHFLDPDVKMSILAKVKTFNKFTEGDDPYGEHDFGVIEDLPRAYFKIDYYADETMEFGAEDKDKETAYRVLVIMLADDY